MTTDLDLDRLEDVARYAILTDAEFIAAAREAIPALVAELREWREGERRYATCDNEVNDPDHAHGSPAICLPCWFAGTTKTPAERVRVAERQRDDAVKLLRETAEYLDGGALRIARTLARVDGEQTP